VDEADAVAPSQALDLGLDQLPSVPDGDADLLDPARPQRRQMALEERPAAEFEQDLRPAVGSTQPPSDAGREDDRGGVLTVLRQWPLPGVAAG